MGDAKAVGPTCKVHVHNPSFSSDELLVSPEMFIALAKPGTAAIAQRLISEKGLAVSDDLIELLAFLQ